jgi:signal transduction histidine kinase
LLDETCPQAGRFLRQVRQLGGSAVCRPMMIEGQVQGTLTVYKAQRRAFAEADLEFLQQVANLAIDWLKHLQEQRAREIALELEEAVYQFPEALLAGKELGAIERDFYLRALFKFKTGIGAGPVFVGIPSPTDGQFEVFDIGHNKKNLPPGCLDAVKALLQHDDFLVLPHPAEERTLKELFAALPGSCRETLRNRECWLLAIKSEGELLAVFFLFATARDTMSYIRAEQARDILGRVSSLIELARSHEHKRQSLSKLGAMSLIGAMTSSMEHQLRGPARRMDMYIDSLTKGPYDEKTKGILHKIKEEMAILNKVTEKLIAFARQSSMESELSKVGLSAVLEAAWQGVLDERHGDEVPRIGWPAQSNSCIKGLREPLVMAFQFILQNAVQAIKRKQRNYKGHEGCITIRIEEDSKRIAVRITDNGDGMDERMRKQAPDPFVSGHTLGTGLGLTAAFSIFYYQKADMRIDSQLGKGTTVTIFLTKEEDLRCDVSC